MNIKFTRTPCHYNEESKKKRKKKFSCCFCCFNFGWVTEFQAQYHCSIRFGFFCLLFWSVSVFHFSFSKWICDIGAHCVTVCVCVCHFQFVHPLNDSIVGNFTSFSSSFVSSFFFFFTFLSIFLVCCLGCHLNALKSYIFTIGTWVTNFRF